jgi:hypothetical protein
LRNRIRKKKVPTGRLKLEHRIPAKVRRHGLDLPTDVIELPRLRLEMGFSILDGAQQGTLGCFASRANTLYGLTCAHCVAGPDQDLTTSNNITVEFPRPGDFLSLGPSADAGMFPGSGLFPDYGNFDAALVEITAPVVKTFISNQSKLPVFRPPPQALAGTDLLNILQYIPVEGWGAGTKNVIRGRIGGVFVDVPPDRFDLMIEQTVGAQLTREGDSGMIWIGPSGQAFGIHMVGDGMGSNNSSLRSFAAFAFRAVDRFGINLLAA